MAFESYRSYYHFADSVRRSWRYVFYHEHAPFLTTLLSTSIKRLQTISRGTVLWRAQLGHAWRRMNIDGEETAEIPCPFPTPRMKPLPDRAPEGRANPKGIPYLYLATKLETAIAETRPWIGSYVSVAQLTTTRDLRVISCNTESEDIDLLDLYYREPDAEERERQVWRAVDRAFAEPVTRSDDQAEYAPPQIIAEFFRRHGFDGLAYRSSLGPGHNVVCFGLEAAEVTDRSLVQIASVFLDFRTKS